MKKSKTLEIKSHLFKQLAESTKLITPDVIFQNVGTGTGTIKYRVVVMDDTKFKPVMNYIRKAQNFVPINFGELHQGTGEFLEEVSELHVHLLEPIKFYSVYGNSYIYRFVTVDDGHLIFTITNRKIDFNGCATGIITAKIKKHLEYLNGNVLNVVNYLKLVKTN